MLEGVQPEYADAYWPHVGPWVKVAALDTASWTADDWLERIKTRDAQLWLVWTDAELTGVIITELYNTAAGRTCALPIVGGSGAQAALPLLAIIERWAREHECVRLQGDGREGWVRALRNEGWRLVSVQVEKRIA